MHPPGEVREQSDQQYWRREDVGRQRRTFAHQRAGAILRMLAWRLMASFTTT
jgi:hypothetical protein